MNKFYIFIFTLSCFGYSLQAQQTGFTYGTTTIDVPLAAIVDVSELTVDFDPKLLLIKSAMPLPVSGTKQKKILLDAQRNLFVLSKKEVQFFEKTTAPSPTILKNFIGNYTQGTPNDNDIAISNGGKIVSVANTNLNFFNDSGVQYIGKSLANFATKLGKLNRTYDPRVIYDPVKDRFIVVFLQGVDHTDTRIIVAFSQSNDPTLKWNFYVIPGNITQDSSSWSDYPVVALTNDELFITVNRVKDNTPWQTGFIESYIWQVDKQKGYDSSAVLSPKVYHDIKYNGKTIWNICPAKGGITTHGPNMYFVSLRPSDLQNDTVFIHEVTNTIASGNASLTLKVLRTDKTYGLMPNAIQPNGKRLQTNDARVLSACYENNMIHYVANTIDTSRFSPAVYYGRISNVSAAIPSIHGTILGSDTLDFGYPSITYVGGGADDNSVMITHSYVSHTQFPGTAVLFVDRTGNISNRTIVKAGETVINVLGDSIERWGDYTGIQRKYNELGYCWLNGSFGYQSGNSTWIAKVKSNDLKLTLNDVSKKVNTTHIYPNPASDYITIDFELNENLFVEFDVMDINGKLVNALLNEKVKAGLNRFSFRVNDLKSGIYFLTIKHENNIVQSKKFIVTH